MKALKYIFILIGLVSLTSCGSMKYSNPGKSKYTGHRHSKKVSWQSDKGFNKTANKKVAKPFDNNTASVKNVNQTNKTSFWDVLDWIWKGLVLAAAVYLLITSGSPVLWLILGVMIGAWIIIWLVAQAIGELFMGFLDFL